MKKTWIVSALLICALLTGCGEASSTAGTSSAETTTTTAATTTTTAATTATTTAATTTAATTASAADTTAAAAAVKQNPLKAYAGSYSGGRTEITVEPDGTDSAKFTVEQIDGFGGGTVWTMHGAVEESDTAITVHYTDAAKKNVTYASDGTAASEEPVSENGTGSFTLDKAEKTLKWADDQEPGTKDMTFTYYLSEEQALAAIKNYCLKNNPELESKLDSDEYNVRWEASTDADGKIVVLFVSYTGAETRYYIDPASGETYATERVPGIIDEEQRTEVTLNVKDYFD